MTITRADLIPLAYASELPLAGCLYACRGLFHAADYTRASRYIAMRQVAGQAVIELAFQRFLSEQGIPFYLEAVTPFTTPDHASLVLGGHLCQVVFIINNHPLAAGQTISQVFLEESWLPLPREQGIPDAHEDEELLIYAVLSRLPESERTREALRQSSQEMLVHSLPVSWAQPQRWAGLGEIGVKSGSAGPLELCLDGQNEQRQYQTETLCLLNGVQQVTRPGFYALATLRTDHHPTGKVEIHRHAQAYVIGPHQWASLWYPGSQVALLGYLSRGETRRMAPPAPGAHFPLTLLHPLPALFERVKQWGGDGTS
jgi:hypothetical protein